MSIATAITNAQNKVAAAYTSVNTMGGTLPATQNLSNLPTAIESIKTDGIPREIDNGVYKMPTGTFTYSLPSGVTDLGRYVLSNAFHDCTSLTSADLSSLTTVTGANALNSVFYGCTSLTSVNFSSLTTVTGVNILTNAFYGCTSLTSLSFPTLTKISGLSPFTQAFRGWKTLTSVSFPALTRVDSNAFSNMMQLTGTDVTHTLHFPSNLQSTISGLSGYPLFGGSSGYVVLAFDLPATS